MKKVSVIVPVYNSEKVLRRCLESLCNQTYSELQILLIDDGSIDKSLKICCDFKKKDKRIEVYTHPNHGVSYTRNIGIEKCDGEYIIFIDSDDEVLPNMIESYVMALERDCSEIVIGGICFISADKQKRIISLPTVRYKNLAQFWEQVCLDKTGIFGYVPNKMYSRKLIEKEHLKFNENLHAQEDLEFALRAFSKAISISTITEAGYLYFIPGNHRNMNFQDIIRNLKMIKSISEEKNVSKEAIENVIKKIQKQTYIALYYAKKIDEISVIYNCLDKDDIDKVYSENRKERVIIFLLKIHLFFLILLYFNMRSFIRLIIKREK